MYARGSIRKSFDGIQKVVPPKKDIEKRKNEDYVPDDKRTIQHVDEVLKMLSVITGDDRYTGILSGC